MYIFSDAALTHTGFGKSLAGKIKPYIDRLFRKMEKNISFFFF